MSLILPCSRQRTILALFFVLTCSAALFAQEPFTITSFTVSPSTVVSYSPDTFQANVQIQCAAGYENYNVVVHITGLASSDVGISCSQPQGQSNFTPPFVTQDTSGVMTASLTNPDGYVSTSSTGGTILANKPTLSAPGVVVAGVPTNATVNLVAPLPPNTSGVVDGTPSLLTVQIGFGYGAQSASGNVYGSDVTEPTATTVTPWLNAPPGPVYGDPVTVTIVPNTGSTPYTSEPSLPCPQCAATTAEPINLTNGNVWITQQDYSLPGLGGGLSIARTWNSLWRGNDSSIPNAGMFGDSWRSTYEEHLKVIDSNNVKYYRANGDGWYLGWNSSSQNYQVLIPQDQHATLTYNASTSIYTLILADGTKRIFNAGGYLTSLIDRNGNTATIAYDGSNRITTVTDAASRVITFSYNDPANPNQATSVADSVGTIASYTYDSSSRLTQVTFADSSFNTFVYDSGGNSLINSVLDSQGKVLESHTYDSSRRGLTSSRANGVDSVTVSYPSFGTVTLTDSANNNTTYGYEYVGPIKRVNSVAGPTCNSCGAQTNESFTFNETGTEASSTDALGDLTNYGYDANGNKTSQSTQLANGTTPTWNYTYNSFGEVLTATDPLNHTTTNVYDPNGNLLTTTTPSPDGGTTPASTTTFTYNTNGTLKTIKDPLGNLTTLTYYPTGLINTIKDATNKVTTYVYDGRGNRTSIQDPVNGVNRLTAFTYDSMNRLKTITYPAATTSIQFHYDYRGRRDYVIDQNGQKTSYGYDDADRLISVTDSQSPTPGVTHYGYDTENNLTASTMPAIIKPFSLRCPAPTSTNTFPSGF